MNKAIKNLTIIVLGMVLLGCKILPVTLGDKLDYFKGRVLHKGTADYEQYIELVARQGLNWDYHLRNKGLPECIVTDPDDGLGMFVWDAGDYGSMYLQRSGRFRWTWGGGPRQRDLLIKGLTSGNDFGFKEYPKVLDVAAAWGVELSKDPQVVMSEIGVLPTTVGTVDDYTVPESAFKIKEKSFCGYRLSRLKYDRKSKCIVRVDSNGVRIPAACKKGEGEDALLIEYVRRFSTVVSAAGDAEHQTFGGAHQWEWKLLDTNSVSWSVVLTSKRNNSKGRNDLSFWDLTLSFVNMAHCVENEVPPSDQNSEPLDRPLCFGSGFFVSTNGYLVTNHHVIDASRRIRVLTDFGSYDAKIVAEDCGVDLAILKIESATQPLPLSDANRVSLGQDLLVVGFPRPVTQGVTPKITQGIVSGEMGLRDDVRTFQTDASIQPGNSGGPVVDMLSGNLIGVVKSTLRAQYFLNQEDTVPQNVNYAIKVSYVRAFLDSVPSVAAARQKDAFRRGRLKTEVVDAVRRTCALIVCY